MTQNNNCTYCGGELKLIPAGISKKSNKHYDAFYSCQNCQKTRKATSEQNTPITQKNDNMGLLMAKLEAIEDYIDQVATDVRAIRSDLSSRP